MARVFPHSYISCPCTDISVPGASSKRSSREVRTGSRSDLLLVKEADETEGKTFDPGSPRANYSLYPLEHLLYCEDCHEIRCPRCTLEEIICWYCPNCLFEVPSSMVKAEGNRCQRNCFNCPICMSSLSVNALDRDSPEAQHGQYVLACGYCSWTSLEIGMQFDKPNNISGQMEKLKSNNRPKTPRNSSRSHGLDLAQVEATPPAPESPSEPNPDQKFASLRNFYTSQINEHSTNPLMSPLGDYGFGSPSGLARIMNMYIGHSGSLPKATKTKHTVMREAYGVEEGIKLLDPLDSAWAIEKMKEQGWDGMTSVAQRAAQTHPARFVDGLKPIPTLLRTKRSKRCKTCRHILVKPEAKVQTTRFRIRLVALNYVPRMSLRPLQPPAANFEALPASRTMQVLLTLTNPLFDPVKVTLATPGYTPGRFKSKVTILCPQFEVSANTDVWDDALNGGVSGSKHELGKRAAGELGEGERQAEAGKVWDKGRNWTTVVLEVTTASLDRLPTGLGTVSEDERSRPMQEDDDVLEIPMFARIEYEADPAGDDTATVDKAKKEKRELAYWSVICVGRIVQV